MSISPNTRRHREALKKIYNRMSDEERLTSVMLKKLYRSILCGNKVQAGIISKSIVIMFPKADVAIADTVFEALWKLRKYKQAIRVYVKAGKPFWHSQEIGRYYERKGFVKKAMLEYQYLISEYCKIGKNFLPLPQGPAELFKLGKWHTSLGQKAAARDHLKLYLRAEDVWRTDPAFHLTHKKAALRILGKLEAVKR